MPDNKSPIGILPEADVIRVHGHANFGDDTPREVVDEGVLKYALRFGTGATQLQILGEHGLVKRKTGSYKANLTPKGWRYFTAVYGVSRDEMQSRTAAADMDARAGFMHELMAARARRLAPAAPAAPVVVNRFRLPGGTLAAARVEAIVPDLPDPGPSSP